MGWNNLYEGVVYQAGGTFTSNFNVTFFAMWAETCDGCDGEGKITSSWSCDTCRGTGSIRECINCGNTIVFSKCSVCSSTYYTTLICGWCHGDGGGETTSQCGECDGLTYIPPTAPTVERIMDK